MFSGSQTLVPVLRFGLFFLSSGCSRQICSKANSDYMCLCLLNDNETEEENFLCRDQLSPSPVSLMKTAEKPSAKFGTTGWRKPGVNLVKSFSAVAFKQCETFFFKEKFWSFRVHLVNLPEVIYSEVQNKVNLSHFMVL